MTFISSRAPLLFGAAGCGVCGCLEAASYYYWRDSKTERRGALLELAASTGNSVAGGICTALAARTVLSRSWVQDALTVRYTEAPTIFRKAGGRIGARASIYFLAATVVSSVTSSWVGGDHLPLAPLLPSLPVIILFWLPGWMPVLAPAYVGGSVFGLMVGNRARVEILSRGGGLDAAAAVLRPGYPYAWSFLVRVQLSTVAFIMSLPKAILRLSLSPSDFSSGGDDGGSGSSFVAVGRRGPLMAITEGLPGPRVMIEPADTCYLKKGSMVMVVMQTMTKTRMRRTAVARQKEEQFRFRSNLASNPTCTAPSLLQWPNGTSNTTSTWAFS